MRRPAWAAAGSYVRAWASLEHAEYPHHLEALAKSRVLTISREQVAALPSLGEEDVSAEACGELRLPFSHVYVCMGGAAIPDAGETQILGALVYERDQTPGQAPSPIATTLFFGWPRKGKVERYFTGPVQVNGRWFFVTFKDTPEPAVAVIKAAAERVTAVLSWLESYNVELVEAPLSPRQRRRELEKGRQIALTVQVKQGGRRAIRKRGRAAPAHYSHQFERSGAFLHNFETKDDGTPNLFFAKVKRASPDKLCLVDGRECVRMWQPPHVKGPVDRPLIPKVRVVTH